MSDRMLRMITPEELMRLAIEKCSAGIEAGQSPFGCAIARGDQVLAVEHNGDAVAYPVRLMAYHHVVKDNVGGMPIVSTY